MSDHDLAPEAHKTTYEGMMANSRIMSLIIGMVLLILAALFGVPVPLIILTALFMCVAFVFMGGSMTSAVLTLIGFAGFGILWKIGSWILSLAS